MSDLLSIGASGVTAYRAALSVVGDNVANAETDGYSRRTVSLKQANASFGNDPLTVNRISAGGITQGTVVRAWDDFRASESRVSQADASRAETRLRWLSNVETAIDDGPSGAGAALTTFFNSGTTLSADPGGTSPRRAFLGTLADATGTIRTSADALARASQGVTAEAKAATEELNGNLKALSQVNEALNRAAPGSAAATNLADTRDQLLDDISKKVGIDVSLNSRGSATVTLAGFSSAILVEGRDAGTLAIRSADDGRLLLGLTMRGELKDASPTGGSLAGLIDVAGTVAGRRADLDAIAKDFAKSINDWQTNGKTPAGTAGTALLTIGAGAASLRMATDDPSAIAAASDTAGNGNLAALQTTRESGAEGRLAMIVTQHALTVASAKSESAASTTRRDNAFAARDEVGGVDLDREAAELLRYQQAYSGSAKLIQIARETLQEVMNLF